MSTELEWLVQQHKPVIATAFLHFEANARNSSYQEWFSDMQAMALFEAHHPQGPSVSRESSEYASYKAARERVNSTIKQLVASPVDRSEWADGEKNNDGPDPYSILDLLKTIDTEAYQTERNRQLVFLATIKSLDQRSYELKLEDAKDLMERHNLTLSTSLDLSDYGINPYTFHLAYICAIETVQGRMQFQINQLQRNIKAVREGELFLSTITENINFSTHSEEANPHQLAICLSIERDYITKTLMPQVTRLGKLKVKQEKNLQKGKYRFKVPALAR